MFKSEKQVDGLKEAPSDCTRRSLAGETVEIGYGKQLSEYTEMKQSLCLLRVGHSPLKADDSE